MAKTYKEVARFESRSRPGKFYTVKVDEKGNLSCNCPAWIYKTNGERSCKHTEQITEEDIKEATERVKASLMF